MKKHLLLLIIAASSVVIAQAQTDAINIKTTGLLVDYEGNTAIDASALLQLNSDVTATQGFLVPRVALTTNSTTAAPVVSPANSLLIYNTASVGDVTPGFYYWNTTGSAWVRLISSSNFGGFANPTATLGLTAINGSASTAMRSDAAPALSQAIIPTWTGLHTFTAGLNASGGTINLNATSNFAVNIGTGTTNANVSIGNSANQIVLPRFTVVGGIYYNSTAGGQLAYTAAPTAAGQYLRSSSAGAWAISTGIPNSDLTGSGQIIVSSSGVGLSITGSPVALGGTVTINSNGTSANTASTLVARDASGNFSAGLVTANLDGQWKALDDRTISPNEITSGYAKFGFTSYGNNNSAPYADYLHLRSYTDATGGNDNLVMFRKDAIGMRIYQQAWNSATAYSSYKTVAFVEDIGSMSGFANPTATLGLTAINGSATTAMRSDAAPALSQAIVPTWTGIHTFSNVTASTTSATGAVVVTGGVGIGGNLNTTGTIAGGSVNMDAGTGYSYTPYQGANKILIGWNRSGGSGETDIISTPSTGLTGGFSFYNLTAAGVLSGVLVNIAPSGTYTLTANGKLKTSGIDENSDVRLKKDINPISDALHKVMEMRGVTYNWRKDEFPDKRLEADLQYGLIAQELETVIPELVTTGEDGYKAIEYSHLVPVLIEAIKELEAKNNKQEDVINSLLTRMNAMENTVEVKTNKAQK